MNWTLKTWRNVLVGVAAVFVVTGCASQQAKNTENLLTAAGFNVRYADTPEKLTHLENITQRKLIEHSKNEKPAYLYADAKGCKCLYVGDEKNYQQYKKLAVKEQIANDQLMASEMNVNAAWDWGMWY